MEDGKMEAMALTWLQNWRRLSMMGDVEIREVFLRDIPLFIHGI